MLIHQNYLPVSGRSTYVIVLVALLFSIRLTSAQTSASFTPSDDVYTISIVPTGNYGTTTILSIFKISEGSVYTKSLLRFDLSSIPDNAIITSAELKMEFRTGIPSSFLFQQLTEDWSESTVTWNTIPTETTQYEFTETPTVSNWSWDTNVKFHHFDDLNLTTMVQRWVNYPNLNYGFIIDRDPAVQMDYENSYQSKEAGISYIELYPGGPILALDHKPKLIVQYVLPIEIDLVSVTHASTTSSGDGSITATTSGGNGSYTYQWFNSSGNAIGTNSPTISGLNYGWYGVKVTDGLGVESYMSFIVGVECEKVSITYNPGSDYVDDAYISNLRQTLNLYPSPVYSDYIDHNYGGASSLTISRGQSSITQYGEVHNSYNTKALVRFNLFLDPDFTISKSNLKLQVISNSGSGNTPFLKLITEQWQENVVTYNHQPVHNNTIQKSTNITSTGLKTIDTKAFWEYWQGNPNYGYFIDLQYPSSSGSRNVAISSSENGTPAQRPQIEFEVSLECPKPVTLKERLNGELYLMYRPVLFFHFDELQDAETGEQLKFEIRDNTNTVIASSDHFGAPVGVNTALPHRTHGNYHTLFLSGLNIPADVVHTLIVYSINGKKRYLNFKKVN
ncbi:hypothetical protein GCM10009118_25430 [Wandonia haliotis]|uniref:Carbohydrate-binding module family 96 domain-containing protein n=1 Tax=Wandonia haliotis TaxID=574963 RepID=A0ABN1MSA1_9FLAO